jgi:hypothetical protein
MMVDPSRGTAEDRRAFTIDPSYFLWRCTSSPREFEEVVAFRSQGRAGDRDVVASWLSTSSTPGATEALARLVWEPATPDSDLGKLILGLVRSAR